MTSYCTQSLNEPRKQKCAICDDPPYISFSWKPCSEPWGKERLVFVKYFEYIQNLKFGSLYRCKQCGLNWWLDDSQSTMNRIAETRFELLMKWNSKPLRLTPPQLEILNAIGGTERDHYGNCRDIITIPCAITKSNGQHIDPCLIWITKRPPIDDYYKNVDLFDGIQGIAQTDYALPLEVRIESLLADEVSMGFTPLCVESISGERYTLTGHCYLFDDFGFKGKDINIAKIVDNNFKITKHYKFPKRDIEYATCFFVDWFEGAEKLDKAVQRRKQKNDDYNKWNDEHVKNKKPVNLLRKLWELIK